MEPYSDSQASDLDEASDTGWENYTYLPSGLEHVENLEMYEVGGLHPVELNELYHDERYKIVHKLGSGGFSTTWLARDHHTDTYVALKFVTSAESEGYSDLEILRNIPEWNENDSGSTFINRLLDNFWVKGPNGRHLCLVTSVLGPNLSRISSSSHRLTSEAAQKVAFQAVSALKYLHSQGICHGDFTSTNVLLQLLGTFDSLSIDELYTLLGKPAKEEVATPDGSAIGPSAPSYVVESLDFTKVPELLSPRLKVIDFDQAFHTSSLPSKMLGTPARSLAPEAIFDHKVGIASDVWALGCLIFKIRSGFDLFQSFSGSSPFYAVLQMAKILGKLPKKWRKRKFNEDGYPVKDGDEEKDSDIVPDWQPLQVPLMEFVLDIENKKESSSDESSSHSSSMFWTPISVYSETEDPELRTRISKAEAECFFDLLSNIFKFKPKDRIGLEQIADHPWFKGDFSKFGSTKE